jgi:DNA-binding transcriptional LysR family regulator
MEFDHLKGFFFVAKFGSFTEAAARLYISQPAISLQVKALEKELGEKLFDRLGRTIRLTHAGRVLYKEAEELVAKLDEIQKIVRDMKTLQCGRLAIGASDTMSIHFLPELLTAFLQEHPRVELSIVSLLSAQVVRLVKEREIDLGIVTLPLAEPKLEVIPVFEGRLLCIVGPQHAFAARDGVEAREVAQEPVILLEKASRIRQRIDDWFAADGCYCRPRMELSNFEIIKRYVAAGLGVSLAPEGAVFPQRDGVCAVPLRKPVSFTIGFILRRERKLSHTAKAFLEMARGTLERTPSQAPRRAGPSRN